MKYIVFECAGDMALNLMGTAVVSCLKAAHPDREIVVVTHTPEAWLHHPAVYRVYRFGALSYFYDDFIKDQDTLVFRHSPYFSEGYAYAAKTGRHLIDIWCELCGVTWDGALPKLFFSDEEKSAVKAKLGIDERPIFMIQASGGAFNQPYPISWARDLPISVAEEVVAEMNKRGFRTIQMRRDTQLPLAGAEWIPFTLREAMVAVQFSDKRLFVDSVGAHTAAALNLPSVVTWVTNVPEVFGYSIHTHLLPNSPLEHRHRVDSYVDAYDIAGRWHEHPYKTDRIFDAEKILKALLG